MQCYRRAIKDMHLHLQRDNMLVILPDACLPYFVSAQNLFWGSAMLPLTGRSKTCMYPPIYTKEKARMTSGSVNTLSLEASLLRSKTVALEWLNL